MVESLLNLEPSWPLLMDGDKATLLIEMVIFDPNNHKHLVRSAVHRKFLTVNGTLDHKAVAFTILGATVSKTNNRLGLILDLSSTVLSHHHLDCDSMFRSIETCSGGGFMKDGIDKGGFQVAATNDLRQSMADFQHRQGCCDVVVGDIGDDKTICELFHLHSKPCLVAGGFSCQPWSALGDKKGMLDCRSQSLTSILRAAFLMRSHSILLECVQNAGKDKQVREILDTFCRITGLRQVQIDLSLASFWPSRRARWWTVLYSHAFPPFHLMPLPSQLIPPTVNDLLPCLPDWPEEEISQIKLDSYEYGKFQQFGGIGPNCVNSRAPMSTALHGWSCQLIPCPCGCRKFPLADVRLSEKGLFGALVHCPGNMQTPEGIVQNIRHLHPWEIALLSGIVPDKLWGPQLRFSIAALGQMATPIQSLWVVAQFKKHLLEGFLEIPAPKPEEVMWLHIGDIMVAYENFFPMGFHSDVVQNFLDRTHRCLFSHAAQGIVPPFLPSFNKNKGDLESNSSALTPGSITEIPVDQPCPKNASEGLFDQSSPGEAHKPVNTSWHCDYPNCPVCCTEDTLPPIPTFSDEIILQRDVIPAISPTLPFEIHVSQAIQTKSDETPRVTPMPVCGGIPAFQSKKRPSETSSPIHAKRPFSIPDVPPLPSFEIPSIESDFVDQPAITEPPMDFEMVPDQISVLPANHDSPCQIWISRHDSSLLPPQKLQVSKGSTVGELQIAEDRIGAFSLHSRVCDDVGAFVSHTKAIEHDMSLHLRPLKEDSCPAKCPRFSESPNPPLDFDFMTRSKLLDLQQGWVAKDEMDFYLGLCAQTVNAFAFPSFVMPEVWDSKDADLFIQWTIEGFKSKLDCSCAFSTILWKKHWIPLVLSQAEVGVSIATSPEGRTLIESILTHASMSSPFSSFQVNPVVGVFPADCGFQCIGWICAIITAGQQEGVSTFTPVTPTIACQWRSLFRAHLNSAGLGHSMVLPSSFPFGGAHDDIESGLADLLEKHGVPSGSSALRASQILEKMGRTVISKILRSANAWKDLKSCANNMVPKFQLVLASEMEASIKARASTTKPFGDRRNKKQVRGNKANSTFFKLRAEDVVIPDCIFKEGSDVAIKQIGINEIGPEARGIVVVNAAQAYPYVKITMPLSQHGLALLILEHSDPAFGGLGETIRFPAKCDATGEPMIISARLVQLGSALVSRHFPEQQLKVEESANIVIRILAFKDECESDWTSFCSHPVKSILAEIPDLQEKPGGDSCILDVFDRQWLSLRMDRAKPAEAELFVASFRLLDFAPKAFLAQSGRKGLYFEPRTEDGRSPCPLYHVVWLGKIDKPQALLKQQTSKLWTSLVRHGFRFGLRTFKGDAETLHSIHKPSIPFLASGQSSLYVVGPFPYGASRGAISKIFQSWNWPARPMQPKGRAANQLGVLWECQATSAPEFEIYQLEHADVLITPLAKKKSGPAASTDVVASARTIAALQETQQKEEIDPVFVNDPWAGYQPQKQQKVSAVSDANKFEALAATVEKRVNQALAARSNAANGDEPMPAAHENRVSELESRLGALEATVNKNHHEQQMKHHQVSNQIGKVQQQVESQAVVMQNHFDQKMQEQLHQIEALLSKRARSHE